MNIFSDENSNRFSIANVRDTSRDFLQSNSLVARMSFLLLVILIFIILLRVGINILSWAFSSTSNPRFLNGTQQGNQMRQFVQDPTSNGSGKTTIRSRNEDQGIEFTWSVWIYIDDIADASGKYRHIFHKGDNPNKIGDDGIVYPNNAPGLYLAPNTNSLRIIMNTFNDFNENIDIPDIPLNKWVNVVIRCKNITLDVYINGTIAQSLELSGVPKQNFGDVWLCANGGFSGFVSNLWYYDYALSASSISRLYVSGPNRKMVETGGMDFNKPDYLSMRWYFYGNQNAYNP